MILLNVFLIQLIERGKKKEKKHILYITIFQPVISKSVYTSKIHVGNVHLNE